MSTKPSVLIANNKELIRKLLEVITSSQGCNVIGLVLKKP